MYPSTSSPSTNVPSPSGLGTGALIGIGVSSGVLFALLVGFLVWFVLKKKKSTANPALLYEDEKETNLESGPDPVFVLTDDILAEEATEVDETKWEELGFLVEERANWRMYVNRTTGDPFWVNKYTDDLVHEQPTHF